MTKDLDKRVAHAMELHYERGFIDGMQKQMQRTWVGLTDEEIDSFREANSEGRGAGWRFNFKGFARAIEAKFKEKNT